MDKNIFCRRNIIEKRVQVPFARIIYRFFAIIQVVTQKTDADDRPEPKYDIKFMQGVGSQDVFFNLSDRDVRCLFYPKRFLQF